MICFQNYRLFWKHIIPPFFPSRERDCSSHKTLRFRQQFPSLLSGRHAQAAIGASSGTSFAVQVVEVEHTHDRTITTCLRHSLIKKPIAGGLAHLCNDLQVKTTKPPSPPAVIHRDDCALLHSTRPYTQLGHFQRNYCG